MPFENDQFDFALCRAAFKNFGNPQGALNEIHRVLKPGGSALIIDMRRDAPRESINKEVDGLNLDWVNATLTRLTFRHMLLQRAYTEGEFRQFIERAGFDPPRILETLTGLEIHMVK